MDEREIEPFNMICGGKPLSGFFPWQASRQVRFGNAEAAGMSINPLQVHYSKRDACGMCGSHDIDKTRFFPSGGVAPYDTGVSNQYGEFTKM